MRIKQYADTGREVSIRTPELLIQENFNVSNFLIRSLYPFLSHCNTNNSRNWSIFMIIRIANVEPSFRLTS